MTLKGIFKWQNEDATVDLNAHFDAIFQRGVLTGGEIVPVPGNLLVSIPPLVAIADDGMLVVSDTTETLAAVTNQTTVYTILAVYQVAAAPTLEFRTYEASVFAGLVDKDQHIVLGAVTLGALATEVTSTDISYALKDVTDTLGRSYFRGYLSDPSLLPVDNDVNKIGDFYSVTSAGLPTLWGWDGTIWKNMTEVLTLAAEFYDHINNLRTDEKHLSDDQYDAADGSAGAPSATNRYVTEADTRLPTQDENDALEGSHGSPSSSNKYVTEDYPVTVPYQQDFAGPPSGAVPVSVGPIYVGTGGVTSANKYFTLLDATLERGYINLNGDSVQVINVYKDNLLLSPLNPSADADSEGYYSGILYLEVDNTINSAFKVLYNKKEFFGTVLRDWSIAPTTAIDVISNIIIEKIAEIKGRGYDDPVPTRESNLELREALDSTNSYLGSVLETNAIADDEDFERLQDEPFIGDSFVKNIGIDNVYTYENTSLVGFTYDFNTALVTYSAPVNLSSVQTGDIFIDGLRDRYLITSVNDGADQLGIVSAENGLKPIAINTSVGEAIDGSAIVNSNPRDILLSAMKLGHHADVFYIRAVKQLEEFSSPDGYLAYGIVRHDDRIEPRIRLYGVWENYSNTSNEVFVSSRSALGVLEVTGFFSDVSIFMRRSSVSPSLNVSINGRTPTLIDTSASGNYSAISATAGAKYNKVLLASSLPVNEPTTLTITKTGGSTSLDIFGFELVRNEETDAILEPGVGFQTAEIINRDTLDTAVNFPQITDMQRGGRTQIAIRDNSYDFSFLPVTNLDDGGEPRGNIAGNTFVTIFGVARAETLYKPKDIVEFRDTLLAPTQLERKRINTVFPGGQWILDSATSIVPPTVYVTHICSTDSTASNIEQEEEIARYDLPGDFIQNIPSDLEAAGVANRHLVHTDGLTILAGNAIDVTTSGIVGATRAIKLSSTSELKLTVLATRLDLVAVNDTAATSVTISIDGSPFYPYSFPGNESKRRTIFSNARYQTHEVVIRGGATNNLAFSQMILFGPGKPAFSDIPNVVADLHQVARYRPSDSALLTSPYTYLLGGVFYEALSYLSYINGAGANPDWSYTEDFTKSRYGRYVVSENDGAYMDFWFVGDAFELQYITGPDHGIFEVLVDGTLIGSVAGATVVGNHVASKVDAYAASYGRQNIGAYDLTFGYHRVQARIENPRTKNAASTGFLMGFTGYYVCNNSGYMTMGLNNEGHYSNSIDSRKFLPLELPEDDPGAEQISSVRADIVSLPVSSTSATVTFSTPVPDTNYVPTVNFFTSSSIPIFQPIVITNKTVSGFTVQWNSPIPDSTYSLNYFVVNKV